MFFQIPKNHFGGEMDGRIQVSLVGFCYATYIFEKIHRLMQDVYTGQVLVAKAFSIKIIDIE